MTDGTNYAVCSPVHRRLEGYKTPARGESVGKHVQEAVLSFPLTERGEGDATSSHRAASCGQLKHSKEMPWLRQPILGNAGWRAADGLVGHGAALAWWLGMSCPQQQQLLHSNHAVTEPGGGGISAARESQRPMGRKAEGASQVCEPPPRWLWGPRTWKATKPFPSSGVNYRLLPGTGGQRVW